MTMKFIQVVRNILLSECESDKVFQVKYLTFLLLESLIATVLACYSPDTGEPTQPSLSQVISYKISLCYLLSVIWSYLTFILH